MTKARVRIATWTAPVILGLLAFAYAYIHGYFASDPEDVRVVALDPSDPDRDRLGAVKYGGGIDIPRMGQNIGGLSALRWDDDSGRLLALTDDARWVWITPVEEDRRLTGIASIEVGDLLGLDGELLTSKERGDSESLTRSAQGGWLVGFERDHRVWRYFDLTKPPLPTAIDPVALLGPLGDNSGLETLASVKDTVFGCAGQVDAQATATCFQMTGEEQAREFSLKATAATRETGALPTDADMSADGTLYALWRSYSPTAGNAAMVHVKSPEVESASELMVLRPPLNVDNFEGLAVREEEGRTFLYIVSDDNFSANQRTLLMKFEVMSANAITPS